MYASGPERYPRITACALVDGTGPLIVRAWGVQDVALDGNAYAVKTTTPTSENAIALVQPIGEGRYPPVVRSTAIRAEQTAPTLWHVEFADTLDGVAMMVSSFVFTIIEWG